MFTAVSARRTTALSCLRRSLGELTERARLATSALFDSDYSEVVAEDIIAALRSDRRLVFCEPDEMLGKRVSNLAVAFELVSSNSKPIPSIHLQALMSPNYRCREDIDRTGRALSQQCPRQRSSRKIKPIHSY